MAKRPQTQDELRAHLGEQIGFLRRSAEAYDTGYHDEAKRLAVTIRLLFHETRNSKSLLAQLHELGRHFYNTAVPDEPGNVLPYGALIQMAVGPEGATYHPFLDDSLPSGQIPTHETFENWWGTPIFRNADGQEISRRDLILSVADQDGGAHVDPSLNEAYAKLAREEGMGWVFESPTQRYLVRPPELAAVRQVAHEVLKTLDPNYEAHPPVSETAQVMVAGGAIRKATSAEIKEYENRERAANRQTPFRHPGRKIGRNEPCPCGSGKKYKRCHGAA